MILNHVKTHADDHIGAVKAAGNIVPRLQADCATCHGSGAGGFTIDATAISAYSEGDRVFHQKFGYGTITGIEGDKLDIAFEKAGAKKVVAKFVTAAEGAGDVPF